MKLEIVTLLYFLYLATPCLAFANEAKRLIEFSRTRRSMNHPRDDASENIYNYTNLSAYVGSQDGLRETDKITALPGQPNKEAEFDQYAGYVTVDAKAGRALFYYFVEALHDPSNKPLVLWLNGVANMLFLESPAGVGYSYSNTTSDYDNTGDQRTAGDAYTFLINWLERFPEYKSRDFFITGESYGGHYVPELANVIVTNNGFANTTAIKLKGVAIGNALLDWDTNDKGTVDYFWTHALISKSTHEAIQRYCSFNGTYSNDCENALSLTVYERGDIDDYNIYAPQCVDGSNSSQLKDSVSLGDPCSPNYVENYLNLPDVQRALHANTTRLNYPWIDCSGDIDSVCPVTSTQYSLDILGLPIEASWRPWYSDIEEVGGYVVGYKGLVFATVRGAGHMVPRYQPKRALTLFSSFLQGKLPPEDVSIN
uniref:Carboxypeptidase n=1 Tax=Ananas comosus var. bracteatus TaxID=296719 RepID=A0A6V7QQW0_ANACO